MSGTTTATAKSSRYEKNKFDILGLHKQESVTEAQSERSVYTKGEIRKLKNDEVLVLVTQRNIAKLKTLFWKEHPMGQYLEKNPDMYILPSQHYPLWRLLDDGIVDETYDFDKGKTFILEMKQDEQVEIDENYDAFEMLGIAKGKESQTVMNIKNAIKEKVTGKKLEIPKVETIKKEPVKPQIQVVSLDKTKKEASPIAESESLEKLKSGLNVESSDSKNQKGNKGSNNSGNSNSGKSRQAPLPSEEAMEAAKQFASSNNANNQPEQNQTTNQQTQQQSQRENIPKREQTENPHNKFKDALVEEPKPTPPPKEPEKPKEPEIEKPPEKAPQEEEQRQSPPALGDFEVADFTIDGMIDMSQFN